MKLLNDAAMLGSDPLMARHRKRPVSRHQAPGPDGSPAPPEAPDGRLGSALRRVAVTPTFAAGLGIVVAAIPFGAATIKEW